MNGLIGRKLGMTSIFTDGKQVACTIVEMGPCVITQVKTIETDGYNALQLAFEDAKEKNTSKQLMGHFKKASTTAKRKVIEFRNFDLDSLVIPEGTDAVAKGLGDTLSVDDVFVKGDYVDVTGTSKGKGFQGVVKRYNFKGVNDATHGQHNRQRAPGSIGAASYPARVFKGMRMAGRMGGTQIRIANLEVLEILSEKNLILVKGAIPGHKGAYVIVQK